MAVITDPAQLAAITYNMDRPTTLVEIRCRGLVMKQKHIIERVGGKEYPCVFTRLCGWAVYNDRGTLIEATEATFSDFGKREGVTRGFTKKNEVEPTPQQRKAGRQHIRDIATQCMIDQGIW